MDVPELPPELKARLDAADITDPDSLQRALDADPVLARDLAAFFEANEKQLLQATLSQLLEGFAAAPDPEALVEFWQIVPLELEETFVAAVEDWLARAEQAGDQDEANAVRQRLNTLREIQEAQEEFEQQPPLVRALTLFVQAETDEEAREVFKEERDLLLPPEAQQVLDNEAQQADSDLREQFANRAALLRTLRSEAPRRRRRRSR